VCALILGPVGCGGGSSPNAPGGGGSTTTTTTTVPSAASSVVSYRLDGASVTANLVTANFANGIMSVGATNPSQNITLGFALTPNASAPGTYSFGVLSGANAQIYVGNPAAGWQAGVGIGSGTITINTFSSTGAMGTFSFTMAAVPGTGATGTKSITDGTFNVTFTSVR
jgi:hypothetical protein